MSVTTEDSRRSERDERERVVAELERRIELLEQVDDSTAGAFTRWDWLLCLLGAVIVPYLALWWFAG